ncbi:MAG: tRNA (adenosine(37)-N6)-threonylcarbamoyltransferase complex dimerization subunit type 1 TsaB [Shewanella psychromarinicola]|jgi:tRNA threonylcarbamoyladenosine biosynthesis protein TsaB|uniref:tRNA threonylcarbamoyladenosine biosynthesis protein TsaB n=1 Tax=Shewanella psychromarinicola TaxID=2487742 RepID=A0A3N4EBR4_9GAMM|nr:tRNA (adenosine(37)-N6)-threonylcarbamoyltransferase complex dimerization subunit type 1 TsaB [Shewanella psychromarinicola]AZG36591.1 tRNA (adenosine(37)-N6)-threonylcarbamoyltransferase complex dimerization subunit type 1 TsaB [Shewanella psychromarinicola]MCL1083247.1 tRNA (adenosine(37)-N6)-threonylcarbamoyltransferase complex dimerization subunit type 1 TsaB [Shewanella psychromarinicola]RPA34438.1 tRNA (adenosine(37)-N6)-threonylcarbamoyltransferase complex dimerization subunit type 1 T
MPKQLHILALDTCTETCSVALTINGDVYARIEDAPREHSQRLLPMVDAVLAEAKVTLADIDLIAYGRGPGSFTGIRICTSMTQGLALGLDLPVIGISTLTAMAQMAIELGASQVLCCIDARMKEVYWGQYIAKDGIATLVGEEHVSAPEAIELTLDTQQTISVCGTGFEAYPQLLNIAPHITPCSQATYPDAKAMIVLAQQGYQQGLHTSVDELSPVYLRDTVTWKKLPGRE